MANNLCTKCGAAWNGETGKYPCAGGGKCDIPAARELSGLNDKKEKLKAWASRNPAAAAAAALGIVGRTFAAVLAPEEPPRCCSNCGYTKGPNTVLIPRDRCPSCGASTFGKG